MLKMYLERPRIRVERRICGVRVRRGERGDQRGSRDIAGSGGNEVV